MVVNARPLRRRSEKAPDRAVVRAVSRSLAETMGAGTYSQEEIQATADHLAETMEPMLYQLAEAPQPLSRNFTEALARIMQTGEQPVRAAFLARVLNALARLTPAIDERVLAAAVGAPSDYAVLLQILEEPQALAALQECDPLAPARLRDLTIREQILTEEGGTLSAEQAAKLLGISRQAIDKRRREGQLLALSIGRHRYAYPAWQFDGSVSATDLRDVLAQFSVRDSWAQAAFFLSPNTSLNGARPVDALRRGNLAALHRAAWSYGRQGAL